MRFQATPPEAAEGLLKAPAMVDVVFILLSFFIMATQFHLLERDFAMGHRQAGAVGGAVRADFPPVVPVRLEQAAAGGVAITVGQARLPDNDFEALRAKLTQINMPAITVLILADPLLTIGQVARALDSALASPMNRVSVAKLALQAPAAGGPERGREPASPQAKGPAR